MPDRIERRSQEEGTSNGVPNPGPAEGNSWPASALSWRLVAWGGVVALLAITASMMTSLWWLVLVFGLLVPVISALQTFWSTDRRNRPGIEPQDKEAELLGALAELGELTPTTAAMRTTLTVEEAAAMLEKLARKGYLEARTQGAVVVYGLWEQDRGGQDEAVLPSQADPEAPVASLAEPLTEREKEVFVLLASGRTNREIAADLFVTVGTIKAHTSNIYAKLQVRNRAEALARGRELGLLE